MKVSYYLFAIILLFVFGCSKSIEGRYEEAKTLESQKNFNGALEQYESIVADQPASALAESSQYRIALIYNNDIRDIEKSASAYKKLHDLFPSSKNAPTCMFLAGFIYNNDLKKPDMAKSIYETFLQEYPSHELAQSARFELETMGKDPMEFIKKDSTNSIVHADSAHFQKIE